jgi:Domain of unknown function (DUF4282)
VDSDLVRRFLVEEPRMSNDPAPGGEQPAWHGQQPYPGAYGQHGDQQAYPAGGYGQQAADQPASGYPAGAYGQQGADQQAYPGASYPPPPQQGGYGQAPPPWAPQTAQQPGQQRGWPGAQPGGSPAGLGPGGAKHQTSGTFGALLDFGFNTFATPAVIKVLYILGLVAIGLGYIVLVISAFAQGAGYGLLMLVGGAIGALFYVIFFRVLLEFYYAIVRMSEDIRAMRERS